MIRTRRRSARRIRRPILESLEARQLLATFTVMSTADDGGSGTLRYAIGEANAASTPSTIDFKLGTSPATITLTQGQLEVDNYFYGITIDGPGASMLTISGNDASRVFEVGFGTNASISGLTITGGSTTGQNNYGAGLLNYAGNTTLTGCTISGNSSSTSGGGVMTESGSMMITDCTITGNSSGTFGGGLLNFGSATITGSTFSGNTSAEFGGGIVNFGSATITGSTFSGNRPATPGAAWTPATIRPRRCPAASSRGTRPATAAAASMTSVMRRSPTAPSRGTRSVRGASGAVCISRSTARRSPIARSPATRPATEAACM